MKGWRRSISSELIPSLTWTVPGILFCFLLSALTLTAVTDLETSTVCKITPPTVPAGAVWKCEMEMRTVFHRRDVCPASSRNARGEQKVFASTFKKSETNGGSTADSPCFWRQSLIIMQPSLRPYSIKPANWIAGAVQTYFPSSAPM